MLGEIFYWIFNMSIAAAICMIPVLLLRLIRKIPHRIFIWLWIVPFIRLYIPFGISSKYGIMALLSKFTTKTVTIIEISDDSALTMMNYVMAANSYSPITYKVNLLEVLFNIASVVWLLVALAAILTLVIIYFVTLSEVRDAQKLKNNIFISDKIKTPAVYGIIKPKIILPTEYDVNKLNFILMHENAHIKRKDNFVRLCALIIVCIHWFNPLAWLLLKLLYSDIELACDESVLSKCNETERKEYAYTLLSTAEKTNQFTASFGGSKIRIRIENILSYKKISVFSVVAFSSLVIAICYILLTNAS
ncbi:MAG: M56 family metallopeptidase [Clostridia bacterium]|nr:M56 family metallopeptidase [Clostridia bacterium]